LTKDIIEKDVHIFPPAKMPLTDGKFGGGGFPSTGGWYGGNSPASFIQPIEYYLKDRVNTGDVSLDVYDASGALMQNIPAGKRKGINMVYWNLRMKPPKTATGGTKIDYSSFLAPMVLPGTYTLKLKIGDKEYTSSLVLVHDSANKDFSYEDRQLQYKTAMHLYHMHEQLAATVDQINEEQKKIADNLSKIVDAKDKQLLEEYNGKLEDLRVTLLAAKQKSIFADEKKLREEITEVYGAVAGQEARPSNLQIDRANVLADKVKKADQDCKALTGKYGSQAKAILSKFGDATK
jgi:hypothetical protein